MKIAVVGSGIAGLSAAWLLGRDHDVTVYEAHDRLGMDAHAVSVGRCTIDVPMRVVYEGYYPNLVRLYREVGVELERLEYSGTFSTPGGPTYLSYRNRRFGPVSFPMLHGPRAIRPRTVPIVADVLRFVATARRDLQAGLADGITLEHYLDRRRYTRPFVRDFLLPTMAGICTCSYAAVRAYPAAVVLGYFARGVFLSSMRRARHGTRDVVDRLTRAVRTLRLKSPVAAVEEEPDHVRIRGQDGTVATFDHAVLAAQANQTLKMLARPRPDEEEALRCFRYERSTVLMHQDRRLAPAARSLWAPVNFVVSPDHDMPMATIWMNTVYPALASGPDVFQTWNPVLDAAPETILSRVSVERPVVDERSLRGTEKIAELHRRPGRRVWFCGSYSRPGVPLLESAASSGLAVAAAIGGRSEWAPAA